MSTSNIMLGMSKAGHDIRHVYVGINEGEDYYYLVNGQTKTIDGPKKKKKIHVQPIKSLPAEVLEIIEDGKALDDIKIKRILKVYNSRQLTGGKNV